MATKAIAGRKGKLTLSATSTSAAPVAIAEVRNYKLTAAQKMIDATSNDSSGWDEFIGGQKGGTVTFGKVNLSTNANDAIMTKVFTSGATYYAILQPTTAKTQKWGGNVLLTDYSITGGYGDYVARDVTFQFTRAIKATT